MDRRWLSLGTLPFMFSLSVFAAGCRACGAGDQANGTEAPSRGPESNTEAGTSASAAEDEVAAGDASLRPSHRLHGSADGSALAAKSLALLDGGSPACTGAALAFETLVVDPACAVSSTVARALLRDGGDAAASALRQEATVDADGRVSVALVNGGSAPLALPLSWHPRIPAFSVLAEDARHAIFELEAPSLDVGARVGDAGGDGARFAKVVLPAGGRATARITIDRRVVRRLDRPCADGGVADAANACPERLPAGRYVLHVGQLVCDVDAGAPASVSWEVR